MILKITNLYKKYSHKILLDNISLKAEPNHAVFIKGNSGVGKTTLLKIISKITSYDKGLITYNDIPLEKLPQGSTGLVFQNFNLFSSMTVLENILLPQVLVLKKEYKAAKEYSEKALLAYDIEKKRDVYPKDLSGGEQQRVAIIRTLGLSPKIVCFDEPFSALDKNRTALIIKTIKKLQKENTIVFLTTHNEEVIKELDYKTFLL